MVEHLVYVQLVLGLIPSLVIFSVLTLLDLVLQLVYLADLRLLGT